VALVEYSVLITQVKTRKRGGYLHKNNRNRYQLRIEETEKNRYCPIKHKRDREKAGERGCGGRIKIDYKS